MGNAFTKGAPNYERNVRILGGVCGTVAVGLIVTGVVLVLTRKKSEEPPTPGPRTCNGEYQLANQRRFFSLHSTEGLIGRDSEGNLHDNGEIIEAGIDTREDALQYLHTFEAGHAYWNNVSDAPEWAIISEGAETWTDHVEATANCISDVDIKSAEVMVIEGEGARSFENITVDIKGLVVRHGAVLFIGGNVTLKTEFILVESGGLLQCGAEGLKYGKNNDERFNIDMETTSLGVAHQGTVASQYSYKWYLPGVTKEKDNSGNFHYADYDGTSHHISNTFGPRCIAIGFNGNLCLKGYTGSSKMPYDGTWSTRNTATHDRIHNLEDDMSRSLYDDSYACLHGHVEHGSGAKGGNVLQLEAGMRNHLDHWRTGDKIVVTYEPQHQAETTTFPHTLGMPRIWLNHSDTTQRSANQVAVDALQRTGLDLGIEVCTIEATDSANGLVYVRDPLKFNRSWDNGGASTWTTLRRNFGNVQAIDVDTRVHVALLSRPIVITGIAEDNVGAGGYNDSLCTYTGRGTRPLDAQDEIGFAGSAGTSVPDYDLERASVSGPKGSWVYEFAYAARDDLRTANADDSKSGTHDYKLAWRSGIEGAADSDSFTKLLPQDVYPVHMGMWTLGTHGYSGSNASGGAHCMFRLGSSVDIDGVELYRMGSASNSGTIGRYTIHWHGAGYTKSFDEYMPADAGNHKRNAIFQNSSTWCCPSRSVTIHGTSEVTCKNNCSFLTYGSARFAESGVERFCTFDHEIIIANLTCSKNPYTNYGPLFGWSGFSFNSTSVFWLKNNMNNIVRCITTGLPRGMFWNWPVSQRVDYLSNIVDCCPGDQVRRLPSHGSFNVLFGENGCSTNPYGYSPDSAWVPDKYKLMGLAGNSGAALGSNTNQSNTFGHNLMNVTYNSSGLNAYIQTHAAVSNPSQGSSPFNVEATRNLSIYAAHTKAPWPNPNFLPKNGLNGQAEILTTDSYMAPQYNTSSGADKVFKPLTESQYGHLSGYNADPGIYCCTDTRPGPGNTSGTDANTCARLVPTVVNGYLSWAGNALGGNAGGALWLKSSQYVFNGCCALARGASSQITAQESPATSAGYRISIGVDYKPIRALHAIYDNFVSDRAIMYNDGKMLFLGTKTFFSYEAGVPDRSVEILRGEYSNKTEVTPLQEWYFSGGLTIATTFSSSVWSGRESIRGVHDNEIRLYEVSGDNYSGWRYYRQISNAQPVLQGSNDLPNFRSLKWPVWYEYNENTDRVEVARIKDTTKWPNYSVCAATLAARPNLEVLANDGQADLFTTSENLAKLQMWGEELSKLRGYPWVPYT